MKRVLTLISALPLAIALAACGTDMSKHPKSDAAPLVPKTDAQVIVVYVESDAATPSNPTCTCTCSEPCVCSCDCGDGEPIAAPIPGCVPPVTNSDAAPAVKEDAVVQAAADPPTDALAQKKDLAGPDAAMNKDVLAASDPVPENRDAFAVPDAAASRDSPSDSATDRNTNAGPDFAAEKISDTSPDLPPDLVVPDSSPDQAADKAPDVGPDFGPDVGPDLGPDQTPPDTRPPCTTPLCRCAESDAGIILPSRLLSLASLSDYSQPAFSGYVNTQNGFGVYSQDIDGNWMRTAISVTGGSTPESEVDTAYDFDLLSYSVGICECYYAYHDWFSLRRQFVLTQDFCGATGFKMELKGDISKPRPEATLRITLADTACKNADGSPATPDGGMTSDELWWYSIPQTLFSADWQTLQIPFGSFSLGDSRTNDRKLDPRCITAFEINYQYDIRVWCGDGCNSNEITEGSGHFEFRNVQIY